MSNPFDTFGSELHAALPPAPPPPPSSSFYGNGVMNAPAPPPPMGGSGMGNPYGYGGPPPMSQPMAQPQYGAAAPMGHDYDNPFGESPMAPPAPVPTAMNGWGAPPAAASNPYGGGGGGAGDFGSAGPPPPASSTGLSFGMSAPPPPSTAPSYPYGAVEGLPDTAASFGGGDAHSNPYGSAPPSPFGGGPPDPQQHQQHLPSYGAPPPEPGPLANPYGGGGGGGGDMNSSNPYGAPMSGPPVNNNPYGAPPSTTTNPYGAPPPPMGGNPYGAPPPPPPAEAAPSMNPYGMPPPAPAPANPYGAPPPPADHAASMMNPYGAPPPPPAEFATAAAVANPYGAPSAPYGAPPPPVDPHNPYGAPPQQQQQQGMVPYGGPPPANPYGVAPLQGGGYDPSGGHGALVVSQHQNYAYGGYGQGPPQQPVAAVDPFSVFQGTSSLPPVQSLVPLPPHQTAAPAPPSDDDFWGSFGPPQAEAPPPAAVAPATAEASATREAPVEEEKKGEDGLPPGGEWYDARIFTPTLGVMFFKPQELTDSLFLNTEKEIVDGLGDRPVVAFIVEGSSARAAGVELGHVLLKVNGVDVRSPKEASRLIKEGPRPLPLLFYVPSTDVVIAEGEHMVKYDTRETTAPNSAKDWKPKYVVIGGIIAQPWMMNMYRSKSEYDIAVIETQARRPVSVKVKQFSLQGSRIQNDWQGPQMVKYKNKLHPWKFIVVLPVGRNPIKISSPNLSQLKPVHEGIRRVLLAQQRGGNSRGGGGGHSSSQQQHDQGRSHNQDYHQQQQNQYAHHAHEPPHQQQRQQSAYGY